MEENHLAHLPEKPKAHVPSIEDLIAEIRKGKIRVPYFQRGIRWTAEDIVNLFDSVYRGYPVGSLLMWEKQGEKEEIKLGPLLIESFDTDSAWWVIDGQQRLTALGAAALYETPKGDSNDKYIIYFNPSEKKFVSQLDLQKEDKSLVPVSKLLDSAELLDWLISSSPYAGQSDIRKLIFDTSKRLREYQIPIYVVSTDNEYTPRIIFNRMNGMGKSMTASEVFDALHAKSGSGPGRLDELALSLEKELNWGEINPQNLLAAGLGIKGENITNLSKYLKQDGLEASIYHNIFNELDLSVQKTITFLRKNCRIPHSKFLPYITPLMILPRFFYFHENPSNNSLNNLKRWVWRGIVSGQHAPNNRTLLRKSISSISGSSSDEKNAYNLLNTLENEKYKPFSIFDPLNLSSVRSLILVLVLFNLNPQDLVEREDIDILSLLDKKGHKKIPKLVPPKKSGELGKSIANIILQPKTKKSKNDNGDLVEKTKSLNILQTLLECDFEKDSFLLKSHAIDQKLIHLLKKENYHDFLEQRGEKIQSLVEIYVHNMCEWDYKDRPSIEALLSKETEKT